MAFHYDDPADEESVRLKEMLEQQNLEDVIKEVTDLESDILIEEIKRSIEKYSS